MTHWSIRKTQRRQEQVARLGRATGLGENVSAVIDYALAATIGSINIKQEAQEMELTREMMQAAHAARSVALDPGPIPTTGDPKADAEFDQTVERGKEVLQKYTLTYSERYVAGCVRPDVPADAVGILEVDSGYLATNEARRLAIFRLRK